jgi:hypothetical protein
MTNQFHQTNTGQATGNQGVNITSTVYHGTGGTQPGAAVFAPMAEALQGAPWPPDTDLATVEAYPGGPADMLGQAAAEADSYTGDPQADPLTLPDQAGGTWYNRFLAVGPMLLDGGLVVAGAVVETYIKRSPIVAGLQAALRFIQTQRVLK